nr:sarcosine oxidase subunit gamma [Gemmobacter straminiformis]
MPVRISIGPVTISEVVDTALASLAQRMGQDITAAAKGAGIPLPPAGRWEQGATCAAFWLSPEMWMIEAPFASHEDIVAHLKPVFGEAASITEQTDAWARFDVTGASLPRLFELLCNYDIARHGAGSASRTMMEHLGCYVVIRAADHISVLGPRSSAQSLFHALETAAHSVF